MLSRLAWRAVFLGALLSACAEPDLGDVPFYCNKGDPQCPEGYSCVANSCVRNGSGPLDSAPPDVAPPDTRGPDWVSPWPEASTADLPVSLDGPVIKWDLGALPDAPPPTKDGWPPHLGCQSHQECTDSSNPCCCPAIIPQIWACLPLCLNPFCI